MTDYTAGFIAGFCALLAVNITYAVVTYYRLYKEG
jgi:hypothetical protein